VVKTDQKEITGSACIGSAASSGSSAQRKVAAHKQKK
jgi:hypothetical protein